MKLLCFLLCITCVSCFYTNTSLNSKEKIIGGEFVNIISVPYHATLYYFGNLFCSAAIIGKRWLLSGEVCFIGKNDAIVNVKVRIGTKYNNGEDPTEYINLADIIKYSDEHPTSDAFTNLMLLLLDIFIQYDEFKDRIPVSYLSGYPRANTDMLITGFRKNHDDNDYPTTWLAKATVQVVEKHRCPASFEYLFCAKNPHSDACDFDEGGPGIINGKLAAIITGKPNCLNGRPGIYTNVGAFYSWIIGKTGPLM